MGRDGRPAVIRRPAPLPTIPNLARAACLLAAVSLLAAQAATAQEPRPTCPPPIAETTALPDEADGPLTVFAAASLTDAFEALAQVWAVRHPELPLTLSFDASSALRAQVELAAPADVFVSADLRNAELLVEGCLAPGPVTPFAGNELVLVVPLDDPAHIESPADLARAGVRIVAAAPEVPITGYASIVVQNLASLEGYPEGYVDAVTANVVSEEDNVRAVLTKIELGEGDAAIVYTTDARTSEGVRSLPLPEEANVAAAYGAVRIIDSDQPRAAESFLDFLTGAEAQAVLADFGFVPAPAPGTDS
jgi:molybdate transport system substrate-binding protein